MNRYIEIDTALLKTVTTGSLSAKALWKRIMEQPSIDIVRCKECRHWIGETEHYEDREYKACWQLCGQYMNSEFWCKYGEREDE